VTTDRLERASGLPRLAARWRTPLMAWLVSRAIIIAVAVASGLIVGVPERPTDPSVPDIVALLGNWDTTWYLDIARDGYAPDLGQIGAIYTNAAFYPLLPGLMAAALSLGLNPFVVAIVVGNLAFLGALVALRALTAARFGETAADRAVWAMALFPPALATVLAYTEALTLLLGIGAALLALRTRYLPAGLAAAAATLGRPTGIVVAVLIALLALTEQPGRRLRAVLLGVVPSLLAMAAFLIWWQVARGSWLLPFEAQRAWGRGTPIVGLVTTAPVDLYTAVQEIIDLKLVGSWSASLRDVIFGTIYVILLITLARSEGWRSPWVLYSGLVLAVPLSSGSVSSLGRLGLLAFPLVWPAVDWIWASRRRKARVAVAAVLILVLLTALLAIRSP
jgi:hypothetical protein